ncbi:hypothetical protein B7463_g5864, partial [Scytalidium lignicola]
MKRVKAVDSALRYLESNKPKAIIVTDEGITEPTTRPVVEKLYTYIQNGGRVIIGLHFPTFVAVGKLNYFFTHHFGLSWRRGSYTRDDFQLNPACSLPNYVAARSFPPPYSMKALHLIGAKPEEKIFVPIPGDPSQPARYTAEYLDSTEARVLAARIERGYIVYIGDMNPEEGSDKVIVAFCGLSMTGDD